VNPVPKLEEEEEGSKRVQNRNFLCLQTIISINPFLILYSMHSLLDFLLSSNFSHFKDSTILVTQSGVRSVQLLKTNLKAGVTISSNLTWDRHIDNTTGKGNKTLGFIRRNLKDCTKPVKAW
jgi:hypothetical protein